MTPTTFRAALATLDPPLQVEGFAAITGTHRTTCQNWGRERSGRRKQAFPPWVKLLLDAWRAHPELRPD